MNTEMEIVKKRPGYVIEKVFEHSGLTCVVAFMRMGHRCGYVGVPRSNPYYGKDYGEIESPNCHWGLTYSSKGEKSAYPIVSDLWWFGFDCGHCDDKSDWDLVEKYFPEQKEYARWAKSIYSNFEYGEIRDIEYVTKNCKSLAERLVKVWQ